MSRTRDSKMVGPDRSYSELGDADEFLAVFRALGDPTRLRIFNLVARAPLCVCHFQQILGLSQVLVSQHLAYLRKAGLVESLRHAQWRVYRLNSQASPNIRLFLRSIAHAIRDEPSLLADIEQMEASLQDPRFSFCADLSQSRRKSKPTSNKKTKNSR
jgi:ArsR family transcriptional regulator